MHRRAFFRSLVVAPSVAVASLKAQPAVTAAVDVQATGTKVWIDAQRERIAALTAYERVEWQREALQAEIVAIIRAAGKR